MHNIQVQINKWAIPLITCPTLKSWLVDRTVIDKDELFPGTLTDYLILTDQQDSLYKVLYNKLPKEFSNVAWVQTLCWINKKDHGIVRAFYYFRTENSSRSSVSIEYDYRILNNSLSIQRPSSHTQEHVHVSDKAITYFSNPYQLVYKNGYLIRSYRKAKKARLVFNKSTLKMSLYINDILQLKQPHNLTSYFNSYFNDNRLNFLNQCKAHLLNLKTKLATYLISVLSVHSSIGFYFKTSNYNKFVNNPYYSDIIIQHDMIDFVYRNIKNLNTLKYSMAVYNKTKCSKKALNVLYKTSSKALRNILQTNDTFLKLHLDLYKEFPEYSKLDSNNLIKFYNLEDAGPFSRFRHTLLPHYRAVVSPLFLKHFKIDLKYLLEVAHSSEKSHLLRDIFYLINNSPELLNVIDYTQYTRKDFKLLHDLYSKKQYEFKNKNRAIAITEKENNLYAINSAFELKPISFTKELDEIGNTLNICVGSYKNAAIAKQCTIYTVYQYDIPVCCIEYDSETSNINQVKCRFNQKPIPESALHNFLCEWYININKLFPVHLNTKDFNLPVISEVTLESICVNAQTLEVTEDGW